MNHNNSFNFNDDYIEIGCQIWWKLALDRIDESNNE